MTTIKSAFYPVSRTGCVLVFSPTNVSELKINSKIVTNLTLVSACHLQVVKV